MRSPTFAVLAVMSLFLFGCTSSGGSTTGKIIAVDTPTAAPLELPEDSLFTLPNTKTGGDSSGNGEATPTPSPKPTARPTATPKPTATPEPTPTPTPAVSFPPRIQPSGSLTNTYYATCVYPEKASCGEFQTKLLTSGITFYRPENTEHAKDRRYLFFTSNDWTGMVSIVKEMAQKYSPFDNSFGVFGYGGSVEFTN